METTQFSEVYYFWADSENNTYGVTVADSENKFTVLEEFTIDELSAITASESEGGNGESAAWGDAIVSEDGSRIFVNARNADKVLVIDTANRSVETILDVGDRPVHSFSDDGELWVHVDGDGGFNIVNQETLEVSELIEANTVGTGHGKLLLSESLGNETYATNTAEPAVFPVNLETREVGAPITIAGGDPEIGTHDKGYDPGTGWAFFQLTDSAGFSFIDVETNEVVLDQVPILGRISHTPDDEYILILNAKAETNDIGIWHTTLDTHTQPDFDSEVTIGGGVSVNGTEYYLDGEDWEAWIPQTEGDNVAVLNLTSNEVEYIDVGDLAVPEGARHFSRIGDIDGDYFFTYSDEGAVRIDLETHQVSDAVPLGGAISRMAVVETTITSGGVDSDTFSGTPRNDLLIGKAGDDIIFGDTGNDSLVGGLGDDFLEGGNGSDRVTGGLGNDTLTGVDLTSSELGQGERDILVANRREDSIGSDTFILGNEDSVFYNDGDILTRGEADLARILGFNSANDTIQLHGSADLYSLKFGSVEGRTDARILYNPESEAVGEVIARIIDVSPDLNLNDSAFTFV